MLRTCKLLLTTIVVLGLSLTQATTALAQGKGKPGGGGGGSTLPPVRYQVQFWTVPGAIATREIGDMNSSGQTVGQFDYDRDGDGRTDTYRGFLYDPNVDPEYGFDLNLIVAGIPAGWEIRNASAINELGQIAAHIGPDTSPLGSPEVIQAVMIDLNELPPKLYAIPDSALTIYSRASDINDWGDIAVRFRRMDGSFGHYVYNFDPAMGIAEPLDLGISTVIAGLPKINNDRTVVGQIGDGDAYRKTWSGTVTVVKGVTARELNEAGAFCGAATVPSKGNKTSLEAFVYDAGLELFSNIGWARSLNESRDFAGSQILYHRIYGALTVKQLLDPSDPDSSIAAGRVLDVYTVSDRDPVTNFPVLGATSGIFGATLIPVPAP